VKEVYSRREAIVAGLVGLVLLAIVWGPVLLRPLGYGPALDLRTLHLPEAPRPSHVVASVSPARVVKPRLSSPVDINHADAGTLQALPGIGPTLANRIVMHRETYGSFQTVDALMEIEGIGPRRFQKLKPWIEAR
jgi:competence ComEA-like helix-hairpin-helix protein